jgi:3-oxoacyl-[acyl-carrier protein] reductase
MKFDYQGFTVVVTGGTRGIGKAVSEAFLKAGASVVASYVSNDATAEEFRAQWADSNLELMKFDVSNYCEAEKFYRVFDEKHDSLHVLVNSAGIRRDAIVGMMAPEDWGKVLSTNLTGTFNMSKFALIRMMRNRFGRIISLTSPSGKMGFAGQCNYAAAKAGQVAFSKSLSREAAKRGITVNCVSPGFIDTDLIADLEPELKKQYKSQVPMKRFGRPEEVADAILFLASRQASYITGTVLEITGGL